MNIFRRFIPKANAQSVEELESFTLTGKIQGNGYNNEIVKHKVFIKKSDADDYKDIESKINEFINLNQSIINVTKIKLKTTNFNHCIYRTGILTYKFIDPLVTTIEEPSN